jgi:hypothetical protein
MRKNHGQGRFMINIQKQRQHYTVACQVLLYLTQPILRKGLVLMGTSQPDGKGKMCPVLKHHAMET